MITGEYFIRYAHVVLPITLFCHIADNLEHLLLEAPKTLSLVSDPPSTNPGPARSLATVDAPVRG